MSDKKNRRSNMIWYLPLWWLFMAPAAYVRSIGKGESTGTALISGIGAIGLVTIVGVVIAVCDWYDKRS
jgi:hypothetical protein